MTVEDIMISKQTPLFYRSVNNHGIILHKIGYNKGRKHDYALYMKNHPIVPNQVVSVFDLGYLGIEKDFPKQLCRPPYPVKRKETVSYLQKRKKNTTKCILKKGL